MTALMIIRLLELGLGHHSILPPHHPRAPDWIVVAQNHRENSFNPSGLGDDAAEELNDVLVLVLTSE
jgi:hypothetical protein